jgi:hypothetical protein
MSWVLAGGPLTDAELTALVELLQRPSDPPEPLNIDEWSVAADAELVLHPAEADDEPLFSYRVEAEDVTLTVTDSPGGNWPPFDVVDKPMVDVAGKPAFLSSEVESQEDMYWRPTEGLYATLGGNVDDERLLEIARTIAPVPADDPRLEAVWLKPPQ